VNDAIPVIARPATRVLISQVRCVPDDVGLRHLIELGHEDVTQENVGILNRVQGDPVFNQRRGEPGRPRLLSPVHR
jgi:hypothetical protein